MVGGVVIGTNRLTNPSDEPQPPPTAGLPTNTSDPRETDPCALINLDSLRVFGEPRFTTPPFLESCEVTITTTGDVETSLQVIFHQPGESVSALGETSRQVRSLPVVRKDRVGVAGQTGCQDWIAPVGQPWATITAFPYRNGSEDLCAVTETATIAAAETIARNGGVIPAESNRTAGYALALADACDTLGNTTLTTVPGLDPNKESPGFADWSCSLGMEGNGTRIQLHFGLRDSFGGLGDPSTPIVGKTTYRVSEPGNCDVYVVHRPARSGSRVAEIFLLTVSTTVLSEIEACNQATNLATGAEEQLRRNPRDADPCALINLDSLRPFGEPRFGTAPLLESCQADIETANDDHVELRVIFEDYAATSELEGKTQQVGERTVVRSRIVDHWGTEACRQYLVLAPDQPMIVIYALTYDDETIDPCVMAEAATTAAIDALTQNAGITYLPDRTASYSHAGSHACSLLDDTILATVPDLDPDPSPYYANWGCHWDTNGEAPGLSLYLRLEKATLSDYYTEGLQEVTIAGERAFLDSNEEEKICSADVVHRSTPTTTEMLEIDVELDLAPDELCALATNLATTAEKYLPEA